MSISTDSHQRSSITPESIWNDAVLIKEQAPLVHNITNYVVMEFTANILLALGASPVMAHSIEEVADMCSIANSLVVNIGTLSNPWIQSMHKAFETAKKRKIPTVFDPVGAGATPYRTETAKEFISQWRPTVIRGNASEISAVSPSSFKSSTTKGVDSTLSAKSALTGAIALSQDTGSVVVISGESDYIIDNKNVTIIHNGYPLMPKVIGMGCGATAIIGAFSSVNPSPFLAAAHAMAFIGITGEIAAKTSQTPGSFKTAFIDALYTIDQHDIQAHLNVEIL